MNIEDSSEHTYYNKKAWESIQALLEREGIEVDLEVRESKKERIIRVGKNTLILGAGLLFIGGALFVLKETSNTSTYQNPSFINSEVGAPTPYAIAETIFTKDMLATPVPPTDVTGGEVFPRES